MEPVCQPLSSPPGEPDISSKKYMTPLGSVAVAAIMVRPVLPRANGSWAQVMGSGSGGVVSAPVSEIPVSATCFEPP